MMQESATVERMGAGRDLWDRVAIGLSGLCLAHCLATALVIALVASAGGFLLHPIIHETGLGIAVLLGALALGRGVRNHGELVPALVGGLGLGIMAAALLLPHGSQEIVCTITGVSLLAFGHHLNRRALA